MTGFFCNFLPVGLKRESLKFNSLIGFGNIQFLYALPLMTILFLGTANTEGWTETWYRVHLLPLSYPSNKTVRPATQHVKQRRYCRPSFQAVSFLDLAIHIGHQDRAIEHRWTFFFGTVWRKRCLRISLKQLNLLKRIYGALLVKYSHIYAKTLFKKE